MHLTSFSFKLKICKGKRIKNGSIISPTLTRLGCIELDFLGDFLGHGWLDLGVFGCFFWLSFSFLHVNIIHIYIKKKNPTLPTNSSLSCVFRLIWIWVLYYYYFFLFFFCFFFLECCFPRSHLFFTNKTKTRVYEQYLFDHISKNQN